MYVRDSHAIPRADRCYLQLKLLARYCHFLVQLVQKMASFPFHISYYIVLAFGFSFGISPLFKRKLEVISIKGNDIPDTIFAQTCGTILYIGRCYSADA